MPCIGEITPPSTWYVHSYFNPYDSAYSAFINYMNVLSDFAIELDKAIEEQGVSVSEPAAELKEEPVKKSPAKKAAAPKKAAAAKKAPAKKATAKKA